MAIKRQWKIGKGMKNTLPPRIGKPIHKRRIVAELKEDEEFKRKLDEAEQEDTDEKFKVEIEYPSKLKLALPTIVETSPYDDPKDRMIKLARNCIAQATISLTSAYYFDEEKAVSLLNDAMRYLSTAQRI
jgi:hypothetical protein